VQRNGFIESQGQRTGLVPLLLDQGVVVLADLGDPACLVELG
jgi:hypothetical protein